MNRSSASVRSITRARASVAWLFVVFGIVEATWASRVPFIREHLHLSDLQLSLALAGPSVGLLLATAAATRIVGRFGSARVARTAAVLGCAALILPALAWSLPSLAVALALWGACLGLLDITMNHQAAGLERQAGRSVMSRLHASYSVAVLALAPIGSLAATLAVGPPAHFAVIAVLTIAVSIPLGRGLLDDREPSPALPSAEVPADGSTARGSLVPVAVLGFCGFIAEGAVINWSGVLLRQHDHASFAVAPLALTGFSVGMVVGRFSGDRLIERWGHYALAWRAALVAAAGMTIAASAATPGPAVAGYAVLGAGLSVLVPIAFAIAGALPGVSSVWAISRLTTAAYIGLFIGPPIIGTLSTVIGLQGALLGVAILLVVAAAVSARESQRRSAPG